MSPGLREEGTQSSGANLYRSPSERPKSTLRQLNLHDFYAIPPPLWHLSVAYGLSFRPTGWTEAGRRVAMAAIARASRGPRVNRDRLDYVQGQIAFARRTSDERATAINLECYKDLPMVTYDVTIRNARPLVDELSLDKEGFTLIQHSSSCLSKRIADISCKKYLEEMSLFIKDYFGACWVVPGRDGAVVRSAAILGSGSSATAAHIDYAPIAAPMVAARESQEHGVGIRSYSRLMIIHAWRTLSSAPHDFALALCDASTALDTDIVLHDFTSGLGDAYKSYALNYNPFEKWYYFPSSTPDEAILFKGFDSYENCNARAPYALFDNRRAHSGTKPGESIGARFFVYFA